MTRWSGGHGLVALALAACKLDFSPPRTPGVGDDGGPDAEGDAATPRDAAAEPGDHDAALDDAGPADPHGDAGAATPNDAGGDAAAPACSTAQLTACGDDYPCLASSAGYTCRGQFPDWRVQVRESASAGFVVNAAANSVLDQTTGLEWVRSTSNIVRSYADAAAYCAQRGPDQHVPTVAEYASLLNTESVPDVDPAVFPDGEGVPYWTSSPALPRSDSDGPPPRYGVGLVDGLLSIAPHAADELLRVACVRVVEPRFVASANERMRLWPDYVLDQSTGLYWTRAGLEDDVPYATADAWCESRQFGGLRWRTPSVAELLSIADPKRDAMMPSPDVFLAGWLVDVYWTRDVPTDGAGSHYALDFGWYTQQFGVRARNDDGVTPDHCCPVRCVSGP